jgi:predicted O-methyltransferase YrrM
MFIDDSTETLYSLPELAQILRTSQDDITAFIKKVNFTAVTKVDSCDYIKKDSLNNFFEGYFLYANILPERWMTPEFLRSSTSPWATTLMRMYQENFAYPTSVSPNQGQLLKDLMANLNPQNVLEIGCFIGVSTIWMAAGLEEIKSEGVIHSVDLFKTFMPWPPYSYGYLENPFDYAKKSSISAELSHRINFYKMDSEELGRKFSAVINKPIDFLYIDGDHTISGCVNDFVLFYPYVSIGGYIMLHDIYPEYCGYEGPRYLIDHFIKKSRHFDVIEIKTSPLNFGMALIRKLSEDKSFYPGANPRLEIQRARKKLAETAIWQNIRNKPLGYLIKKIARSI